MTSNIDPQYPVYGTPKTENVRNNFAAAKHEIETLQTDTVFTPPVIIKTADYTLDGTEPKNAAIRFNTPGSAVALTIPDGFGTALNSLYVVHRDGPDRVTVNMSGTDTINGSSSYLLGQDKLTVAIYKVAAGKWYALPLNVHGGASNPLMVDGSVQSGEILSFDPITNTLKSSGAYVTSDGSVKAGSPNSLLLEDAHTISSAIQNIFFRNNGTEKAYHPAWVEASKSGPSSATVRIYTDKAPSTFEVGAHGTDILTNPEFTLTATANRRLWDMSLHMKNSVQNVTLDILVGTTRMWHFTVGDGVAEQMLTVDFERLTSPMDFTLGGSYKFKIYSPNGDVQCYGTSGTGAPHLTMTQRLWADKDILHEDHRIVSMVAHSDKTATITFGDGHRMTFNAHPWFGIAPPATHGVYVGWYEQATDKVPPDEATIKGGTSEDVADPFSKAFDLTAASAGGVAKARAFIAWPTIAGDAHGITLGTFTEVWDEDQVEVDGAQYHVFYSDTELIPADISIKLVK